MAPGLKRVAVRVHLTWTWSWLASAQGEDGVTITALREWTVGGVGSATVAARNKICDRKELRGWMERH